jgi:hypothetical protein
MREKQPKIAAWFKPEDELELNQFAIINNMHQTKVLKLAIRNLLESDFKPLVKKYKYKLPLISVKFTIDEYYDFKTLCKIDNIKMAKKIREFIKKMIDECTITI